MKMADGKHAEFWCPYCKLWITGLIHRPDHHLSGDAVDPEQSGPIRVDGAVYDDEDSYEAENSSPQH